MCVTGPRWLSNVYSVGGRDARSPGLARVHGPEAHSCIIKDGRLALKRPREPDIPPGSRCDQVQGFFGLIWASL